MVPSGTLTTPIVPNSTMNVIDNNDDVDNFVDNIDVVDVVNVDYIVDYVVIFDDYVINVVVVIDVDNYACDSYLR